MPSHLTSAGPLTSRTINASQKYLGAELLEVEVDFGFLVQSSSGLRLIMGRREIPGSWCKAPPNPNGEVDSGFLVQSSSGLRLNPGRREIPGSWCKAPPNPNGEKEREREMQGGSILILKNNKID
ncbi:hypothetical protein DVH24_026332 [Malus domestica]|uniref:Uncharacterized protein n=1 Tax=Malus domestica TaxID=3750 RepID=A0A498KIF1_MALDO|nr:hypothetical protein DVH24_026332 [Malus domestica]